MVSGPYRDVTGKPGFKGRSEMSQEGLPGDGEPDRSRVDGIRLMPGVLGRRAFEYLVISLWDDDREVRMAAADALAELKDSRAYRYLALFVHDTDRGVRERVSSALAGIGERELGMGQVSYFG
jgi:hypothetical protein